MIMGNEKYYKKKFQHSQHGAVLLIAITVASLVLAIGLGILNITTKEIILSAYSKESGKAFYASNTGIECALFWDISYAKSKTTWTKSPFATSTDSFSTYSEIPGSLSCAGQSFNPHGSLSGWEVKKYATSATTTFKFSTWSTDPVYSNPFDINNPCVEVKIEKYEENVGLPQPVIRTRISSIGYNTCDTNQKRRVSRGVRVQY